MPVQFTPEELAKVSAAMEESDLEVLIFRSGVKITKNPPPSEKWIVAIPGYSETVYDDLGAAYTRAAAVSFAIKFTPVSTTTGK